MIAEAKFLRAFIYFNFIERFGGVPIVDKVYNLGDEEVFKRNTFDECVAFIAKDVAEAMPDLPAGIHLPMAITEGLLQMLARRCSPGPTCMLHLPCSVHSHSVQKWQKAADAAAALLNKGYALYPDYQKLFEMKQGDPQDEVIFSKGFSASNGHQTPSHQMIAVLRVMAVGGGRAGLPETW